MHMSVPDSCKTATRIDRVTKGHNSSIGDPTASPYILEYISFHGKCKLEARLHINSKYRPIALTNCSFKISSKCATTRLGVVSHELISPNQTAFIRGRYILESVVSAHEIIHEIGIVISRGLSSKFIMRNPMTWSIESLCLRC